MWVDAEPSGGSQEARLRFRVTPPTRALGASAPPLHPSRQTPSSCTGAPHRRRLGLARVGARIAVVTSLLVLATPPAGAASPTHTAGSDAKPGRITGRVIGEPSGATYPGGPLGNANVVLVGTERGAAANGDGFFTFDALAPGTYVVRAAFVGHASSEARVRVRAGEEVRVEIRLSPVAFTLPEVEVRDHRSDRAEKTSTPTIRMDEDLFDRIPVDDILEVVALNPGIVAQRGEIHVRGQRANSTDQRIDGVSVRDPLGGQTGGVSTVALEETEVIVGAMQAKHGPTMSGVINYRTREGGARTEGQIQYETDDFGAPDKTFSNLDRLLVGIGGPTPVSRMTYYVSAQGTWADAYPRTAEHRPHRRVLDFISLGERKVNDVRLQGKLAWRPDIPTKITYELLSNRTRMDRYFHNWSWEGFVKSFADTLDTGEVVVRNGPWASHRVNGSYVHYNAAEHTPDVEQRFSLQKLTYRRTFLDGNAFVTVKVAHTTHREEQSVQGKNPWEYEIESSQDPYLDYETGEISDYYVRGGDLPMWSASETKVTSFHVDHTHKLGKHLVEVGAVLRYNDLSIQNVSAMFQGRDVGREIGVRDRYHVYQTEGGGYVQDTWEHEGMVLNLGIRYDGYSVGQQLESWEVRDRVKWQLSPRVGIAYPVTDLDVFSFQYGRYYQYPERYQLYENRAAIDGRPIGNPDLEPETTVAYQAALQHVFGSAVRGQFAVYYQDVFGLIDQRLITLPNSAAEVPRYENEAYASSRGFEISLTRSFSAGLTGQLSYTYGVATGIASDPSSATSLGLRYVPISEQPLDWDRRHGFGAAFSLVDPRGRWSVGGTWQIQSGFPYTPRERSTRDVEPEVVNSRRLPATMTLNLSASRHFSVWGRELRAFVRADNVLDSRSIVALTGVTPLPSPAFDPDHYVVYYTETGNVGGAYLAADRDGDGQEDWIPLNDPTTLGEGRSVRVGIGMVF